MASPEDLDRLKAALAALSRIGDMQRGEAIRAYDWNALVAAVADLARATLGGGETAAVPPHTHPGEVTIDWLAPALRNLIEKGPIDQPAQLARLSGLELSLSRLQAVQDRSDDGARDLRTRLDTFATRDLERQTVVNRVNLAINALADPNPEIETLRGSLRSIQGEMSTVVAAAAQLRANGRPIDIGELRDRVDALDQMAERLRDANGTQFDAATVERRFAEIKAAAVSHEELTEQIRRIEQNGGGASDAGLEDRLSSRLKAEFDGSFANLRQDLDSRIADRLGGLDALVDQRVGSALPTVRGALEQSFADRFDATRDAAVARAGEAASAALKTALDGVRADLDNGLATRDSQLGDVVRAEVGRRLDSDLAATRAAITDLASRLDGVSAGVEQIRGLSNDQRVALAGVPQQLAQLRGELRDTLLGEVQRQTAATKAAVDAQLAALNTSQQDRLASLSAELRQSAADAARTAAAAAAQSEVRSARVSLLAEMRSVAREEVNVGLTNTSVRGGVINPGVVLPADGGTVRLNPVRPG